MTSEQALVGIVMGSDSDYSIMREAAEMLEQFGIPYEIRVLSAHRTPLDMAEYGRTAADRGLKVIIAGAGGAAHLPGMIASHTVLPVIGVPIPTRYLNGLDSLYSIVQMPAGVPVATVAIGGGEMLVFLLLKSLRRSMLVFGSACLLSRVNWQNNRVRKTRSPLFRLILAGDSFAARQFLPHTLQGLKDCLVLESS